MERGRARILGFVLALLPALVFPWLAVARERPLVEVRARPWQLPAGKLFPGHEPGQTFTCPADVLDRVDLALVRQPGTSPRELLLTLRADGPTGEVLREARLAPEGDGPDFFAFEFEPLAGVAGRALHVSLSCGTEGVLSDWSPWISWRGKSGAARPWGDRWVGPQEARCELKVVADRWTAVALAVDGLNVPAGACELVVRDEEGAVAARGALGHASPIAGGYALFALEPPLAESRWRDYALAFTLPDDARVVAGENGPSLVCLHGAGAAAELGDGAGMTLGGVPLADRDLIFRAYGPRTTAESLRELRASAGTGRLVLAWLASWLAAGWLLGAVLARRSSY